MDQETYVPGMGGQPKAGAYQAGGETLVNPPHANGQTMQSTIPSGGKNQHSPVVGFLYTLSNEGIPEYWPIRIGVNTIGKAADNDIVLAEASVSDHHAQINVKRLQRGGGKLVAGIKDVGSSNGLLLNDEELDYELHNCENESIITVGFNYRLVLTLMDPTKYGIGPSEGFQAINVSKQPTPGFYDNTMGGGVPNNYPGHDIYSGGDETVNINGGPDISGGHTKIL